MLNAAYSGMKHLRYMPQTLDSQRNEVERRMTVLYLLGLLKHPLSYAANLSQNHNKIFSS